MNEYNCKECKHHYVVYGCEDNCELINNHHRCRFKKKKIRITNGDRIRKMTNKELADFIINKMFCPSEIIKQICIQDEIDNPDCKKCWMKFLNSEYKKENEKE